jgi:hypothetical protein
MNETEHPATLLESALERLQVMLRSLGTFYDQPRDAFALQPNFMMLSLGVAETCVAQAQDALASIMQHCDLTLLPALVAHEADEPQVKPDFAKVEAELSDSDNVNDYPHTAADEFPLKYAMEANEAVAEKTPKLSLPRLETLKVAVAPKSGPSEQFAQTYLELLQKLTAAEIFATEQQALNPNQSLQQPLLPLLRSLRQDIQKLHNVA